MKVAYCHFAAFLLLGLAAYAKQPVAHEHAIPFIANNPGEVALKYPTPDYPYALRARRITGAGVYQVSVDAPSGVVIDVTVVKSTGSKALDQCAVDAVKRWLFRPNKVRRARIPIAFTLGRYI